MKSRRSVAIAGLAAIAMVGALAACSDGGGSDDGKLELRVATFPPGADQAAYDAFAEQEKQFEKANPDIDVVGLEYEWTAPTFAAQLAGGSLPDVFTVPFTDSKTLLENGQLMDVTKEIDDLGYSDKFNPIILNEVTGSDGKLYGFPRQAYANGLHYNRALFEQAGLDPDNPPTTWDEVRAAAKTIAEKTGKAGYATMAAGNTGGWQLSVQADSRGASLQTDNGDGTYTSTIDNDATKATLEYLHDLRWEDNAMGSTFDLDWGAINQEFAAGNIGMYTSGSDVYTALVRDFGMAPDNYGLTVIPTENGGGVLGGGDIAVMPPTLDDDTKAAAVKWIDWYYMQKLLNEDAAVADAEALAASDQAVGTPVLPVLDKDTWDQQQEWIAPYVNVPQDQMTGFFDGIFDQTPVGEFKGQTQPIYALMDNLVQAVLTDQNADIDALLKQVDVDAQALLDQ
ncbi:ABC-type glycerol-3-phosphate transport system, substrate-binding protein [Agromyces sp. CF514]|uniref:ABC transporter substrate-binding protein n=1 Tax=Agromyces sp. CF514 TaxID=1881031 RepID=UPI0008E87479|nr:extracellular solute-binding protein [Agromyces sp. CF514]SFR68781.1 ABC-type glycerol-3-phosphate transport system, substrate-binding protein [Agromyces sp. CF514]